MPGIYDLCRLTPKEINGILSVHLQAGVAELADARDLKSRDSRRAGSTPATGTKPTKSEPDLPYGRRVRILCFLQESIFFQWCAAPSGIQAERTRKKNMIRRDRAPKLFLLKIQQFNDALEHILPVGVGICAVARRVRLVSRLNDSTAHVTQSLHVVRDVVRAKGQVMQPFAVPVQTFLPIRRLVVYRRNIFQFHRTQLQDALGAVDNESGLLLVNAFTVKMHGGKYAVFELQRSGVEISVRHRPAAPAPCPAPAPDRAFFRCRHFSRPEADP